MEMKIFIKYLIDVGADINKVNEDGILLFIISCNKKMRK